MKHGTYSVLQRCFAMLLALLLTVGVLPPVEAKAAAGDLQTGTALTITASSGELFNFGDNSATMKDWTIIKKNTDTTYTLFSCTFSNDTENAISVQLGRDGETVTVPAKTNAGEAGTYEYKKEITVTSTSDAASIASDIMTKLPFLTGSQGSGTMFTINGQAYTYRFTNNWTVQYKASDDATAVRVLPKIPEDPQLKLWTTATNVGSENNVSELTYDATPGATNTYYLRAGSNGNADGLTTLSVTGDKASGITVGQMVQEPDTNGNKFYFYPITLNGTAFGQVTFDIDNAKMNLPWGAESSGQPLTITTKPAQWDAGTKLELSLEGAPDNKLTYGINYDLKANLTLSGDDVTNAAGGTYKIVVTGTEDAIKVTPDSAADGTFSIAANKTASNLQVKAVYEAKGYEPKESGPITLSVEANDLDFLKKSSDSVAYGSKKYTIALSDLVTDAIYAAYVISADTNVTKVENKDGTVTIESNGITTEAPAVITVTRGGSEVYTEKAQDFTVTAQEIQDHTGAEASAPSTYSNTSITVTKPEGLKISKDTVLTNFQDANLTFEAADLAMGDDGKGENVKDIYYRDADGVITKGTVTLLYDNVPPVITNITFSSGVGATKDKENATKYLGKTVKVSATVTDAASGVKVDAVTCTVNGQSFEMAREGETDVYSKVISVEEGKNLQGTVTVTAYDNAGNSDTADTTENEVSTIYVDHKAPKGSFKLGNNLTWSSLFNGTWVYNLLNKGVSPVPNFTDDFSGKLTILYYVDTVANSAISNVSAIAAEEWKETASIPENSKLAVYAKVTDEAGNTSYFSTYGLIVDGKDPSITDSKDPSVDYHSAFLDNTIALTVTASDVVGSAEDCNYSGIKSITVSIDNGENTQMVTIENGDDDKTSLTVTKTPALDFVNGFSLTDLKAAATMEHTFTINLPEGEYDGEVKVTITVLDNALLDAKKEFVLKLDNIKPVVAISHKQGENADKESYTADPTVEVKVTENNFAFPAGGSKAVADNEKTTITVTKDGVKLHENGTVWGSWATEAAVHTATWVLNGAEDGKYVISVTSTDKAGNEGTDTATFLLDKSKPEISIPMPAANGMVGKESMYNGTSLAIPVEITEKNFDGNKVTLKVYKYDPSTGEPAEDDLYDGYTSTAWTDGTDDKHTKTLTFTAEGHYRIVVDCQDGPGNPADQKTADFCIDRTKPKGTVISRGKTVEDVLNVLFSGGDFFYTLFEADRTVLLDAVHDKYDNSEEVGSGIKSKLYYDVVAANGEELPTAVPAGAQWKAYDDTTGVPVQSDKRYIVFFKLVDNASNETEIFSTTGMIQDTDAPDITGNDVAQIENDSGVYTALTEKQPNGKKVRFVVKATDPKTADGSSLSGVKDITMSVEESVGSVKLTQGDDANTFAVDGKPTWSEIQDDQTKTEEFIVEANGNIEKDIQVIFTATDHAGNEAIVKAPVLNLDTQVPRVQIQHTESNLTKDAFHYYKAAPEVEVKIYDKNFDPDNTTIDVYQNGVKLEGIQWEYKKGYDTYGHDFFWTPTADGDYTIHVNTTDKAGNNKTTPLPDFAKYSPEINHFVLDTDAPDVSVAMDDPNPDFLEGNQYQFNMKDDDGSSLTQRTATVKILERNFKAENVNITVTRNGEAITPSTASWVHKPEKEGSRSENDEHTLQLTFAEDGDYVITVSCTDLAGNEATPTETQYLFALDSTPPTAEISQSVTDTVWTKLLETLTFGIWKNESITVSGTFSDATTAVAEKYYHIETSDSAEITGFVNREFLEKQADSYWKAFDGTVTLDQQAQYVVYFKAVDNVGNDDYFSTDGIIYDTTVPNGSDLAAPKITVSASTPPSPKGIYPGDVGILVAVEDPEVNNSYSGLQKVTYTVTADSKLTQPGAGEPPLYSFTVQNPTPEQLAECQKQALSFTVNGASNNSNNVIVEVQAVDNAGNTNKNSIRLEIDTIAPVVEVTYNNVPARNGKYFKDTRVATITVTDKNFDWEDLKVAITSTNGTIPVVVPAGRTGDKHTATITFDKDSDYTFEITEVKDKAGHLASDISYSGEAPNAFIVDKTKPVLKFEIRDTVGAIHDNVPYYQSIRDALLTVIERNFFAGEVHAVLRNEVTGETQNLKLTDWTVNGDDHRAGVSIDAEGIYTVSVSYVDLAGNEAEAIMFPKFGLDLKAPSVLVEGVEDGKNYPEKLEIKIRVQDTYLYAEGIDVRMTVQNLKGLKEVVPAVARFDGKDYIIEFDDPAPIRDNDGIYHLSIKVTDMSGRTVEQSYSFIVNRYGSVYYTEDDFTADILGYGYTNKAPELKIIELNPNKLTEYGIDLAVSGNVYNLEEEENFFAEESIVKRKDGQTGAVPAEGWYRYDYTIASNSFLENDVLRQGHYNIILSSKDAAENLNSSTSYLLEEEGVMKLELVIDAENPAVVISGVENDEIYKTNEQNVQFTVDDSNLREVVVWVVADYGGRDAAVLSRTIYGTAGKADAEYALEGVQITENTQLATAELADLTQAMLLMENNEEQTVIVTAVDMAGNETSSQVEDFTISTNPWLLFLRSVWFIPAVAATIGLFAAIMYLFYKKNQKARDAMGVS